MEGIVSFIPLILLLVLMYFLMIKPQKKREKETNAMRAALKAGDEIVTIGGILGKVVKTKEETIVIQCGADKTKLEIMRWAVSRVLNDVEAPAEKAAETVEEEEQPKKKVMPKRLKPEEKQAEEAAEEELPLVGE